MAKRAGCVSLLAERVREVHSMSVLESLYVGLFGILVVFIVLIGLSLLVGLQSLLLGRSAARKAAEVVPREAPACIADAPVLAADEPIRLIGVDDKTAALVMAIVCEEMCCDPEELYFKSIKALDQESGGAQG